MSKAPYGLPRNGPAKIIEVFHLPGTYCVKFSHLDCRWQRWHVSLCIVVQGHTEIVLDSEVYRYDGVHYIAAPIDLPVTSRLFAATPEQPFLCLKILFDSVTLTEIAAQIEKGFPNETEEPARNVYRQGE